MLGPGQVESARDKPSNEETQPGPEAALPAPPLDFKAHRTKAVDEYVPLRPTYERFATTVRHIIEEALQSRGLKVHSIEVRAKSIESFGTKAEQRSESDPTKPKYLRPLEEIEDLAGVRVITYLPRTVIGVEDCIAGEFAVLKREDVGSVLRATGRFGYQSVHYVVKLQDSRLQHTEYRKFSGLKAEIQVRTVLQHAWAEIEHDIRYKSASTTPAAIGRRFDQLAGLLEIADREFQTIQDDDENLRKDARNAIQAGRLGQVEITSDSLRSYLDAKLGEDQRIADWSYEFEAQRLKAMGFAHLGQIDNALGGYDDDAVGRAVWGSRQGQLSRFQAVLIAAMGESYLSRYLSSGGEPYGVSMSYATEWYKDKIEKLRRAGIKIGHFDPKQLGPSSSE